ncbi:MAG: DUF4407 domain-containing protein [Mucilaginibacter polytrichastri]|nr:DUF4407 domain-containing protein [Mucilaginibacter polytrichastri]
MKKITQFFWFCSGAHVDTLKKYPIEHNKYVGIGATIFFTALFASLSGGYAMYFVFSGTSTAVLFALFFGLIWGLAIFNMDRYIVSSISKTGTSNQQILQALPRILLAIMIGIVISRPLELKIFNKEIREKLKTAYLNGQRTKIDTLQKAYLNKYTMELARVNDMKREKDSLAADVARQRVLLNQEIFGAKNDQTSGKMGYGQYAKRKEAVVGDQENRLKSVQGNIDKMQDYLDQRKNIEGLNSTTLWNETQLDSLANIAGFSDRNWALGQLSYNVDGSRNLDTYLAQSFIAFLFILFECLPVFVKLMSPKGPYDVAIQKREESDVHFADREKDHDISVTDGIYDHKVDTETGKQKEFITRRSKRELDWDEEDDAQKRLSRI